MREGELNVEHIWLRQSVTYTHEGQSRTIEIALPIHPDASPEAIARLVAQAEAGMAQLTTSLDRRIAGEQIAPPRPIAPDAPHWEEPAHAPNQPSAGSSAEPSTPPAGEPEPTANDSQAAQASPRQPTPASRPASAPLSAPPTAPSPDLTRPEFIAEIAALGLNPKEAMDRLGVRSLAGLNLREALETLRRQSLRPESSPAAQTASQTSAQPRGEARAAAPDRFDEEDDEALIFMEEGAEDGPPTPPHSGGRASGFTNDTLDDDLDDVPDFSLAPSPRSRAPEPAPAAPPTPKAERIISGLRALHPGGAITSDRQGAFTNVVVNQLGEPKVTALARGLWKLAPERVGSDQLEALIHWGKSETFSEEVEDVLATLRVEQRARTTGASSAPARGQTQSAPSRRRGES
jgi:hypothetical protein